MVLESTGVRLSVAIMHDSRRATYLPTLLDLLGHPGIVQVVTDTKHEGPWVTARRAWHVMPPESSHHLLLQDDIYPCRDFLLAVCAAIAAHPTEAISYYANRKVIEQARDQGSPWACIRHPLGSQAISLPREMVLAFLPWTERHCTPDFRHDDSRLAMYLLAHDHLMWCTAPCLVEHVGFNQSVNGIPAKVGKHLRLARWFIGPERSGLSIEWTKPIAPPQDLAGSLSIYTEWYRGE